DRPLELCGLEAERALAALEHDPPVRADEVEAVGPTAVRRRDRVVELVDHGRQLDLQLGGARRGDVDALGDRRRLVHRNAGAPVLREDPALFRMGLADVDEQEGPRWRLAMLSSVPTWARNGGQV